MSTEANVTIDDVARRLAEQAGVAWFSLSNHPGYQKYIWREKARDMLSAAARPPQVDRQPATATPFS